MGSSSHAQNKGTVNCGSHRQKKFCIRKNRRIMLCVMVLSVFPNPQMSKNQSAFAHALGKAYSRLLLEFYHDHATSRRLPDRRFCFRRKRKHYGASLTSARTSFMPSSTSVRFLDCPLSSLQCLCLHRRRPLSIMFNSYRPQISCLLQSGAYQLIGSVLQPSRLSQTLSQNQNSIECVLSLIPTMLLVSLQSWRT